jgi:hypothetical protein
MTREGEIRILILDEIALDLDLGGAGNSPNGNRTRVLALRGPRPSR